MSEIRRIDKGRDAPSETGEDNVFLIPRDILPEGLQSGDNVKITLEGSLNIDDQGGVLRVKRIYPEKMELGRKDQMQESIEKGLDLQLNIKS